MITIAICTWNRASLLDRTLERLGTLEIPTGVDVEVIVVNNNCTDHTDDVIARHQTALPLRRLFEPQTGLSHARNRAVAEARGDLLLWTDDDVLVERRWLAEYARAAVNWPDAGFFGGTIEPWFELDPPHWLMDNIRLLEGVYAVRIMNDDIEPLPPNQLPFGANMAFRTEILRRFHFDSRLGVTKDNHLVGEEADLFCRLLEAGYRGIWVGTARVRHYIPVARISHHYIREWYRGYGRSEVRLHPFSRAPQFLGVPRWLLGQHWAARLKSLVLAPLRNEGWLLNYCNAALTGGMLEEIRLQHQGCGVD
jgi:glucosyl-dolichyl phosphate glucuronosyltransferase